MKILCSRLGDCGYYNWTTTLIGREVAGRHCQFLNELRVGVNIISPISGQVIHISAVEFVSVRVVPVSVNVEALEAGSAAYNMRIERILATISRIRSVAQNNARQYFQ